MSLTGKDFERAATIVRHGYQQVARPSSAKDIEDAFVEFFNLSGTRFDAGKFRQACQVTTGQRSQGPAPSGLDRR